MIKKYLIYKHTSPNGKIYIGQTCQKPEDRWRNGNGYSDSPLFFNAIQKYGWNNFSHEIVSEGLTLKEANWLESYLIRYYNSNNREYGYNLTSGGEGSPERTITEETRKLWSKQRSGENSYWYGKHLSNEHKNKLSKLHTKHKVIQTTLDGIYITEFDNANVAESETGINHSKIYMVCKGERKTAGGYKWKYKEDYYGFI